MALAAALGIASGVASLFGSKGDDSAWKAAHNQNILNYHVNKNKHDNSLASLKISEANRHIGYSKAISQRVAKRKAAIGRGFSDIANLEQSRLAKQKVADLSGGGTRARGFGRPTEYLAKRAAIESKIRHTDMVLAIEEQAALAQYKGLKKYPGIAPAWHEVPYEAPKKGFADVLGAVSQGFTMAGSVQGGLDKLAGSSSTGIASFAGWLGGKS